jgi:hypothetical protein
MHPGKDLMHLSSRGWDHEEAPPLPIALPRWGHEDFLRHPASHIIGIVPASRNTRDMHHDRGVIIRWKDLLRMERHCFSRCNPDSQAPRSTLPPVLSGRESYRKSEQDDTTYPPSSVREHAPHPRNRDPGSSPRCRLHRKFRTTRWRRPKIHTCGDRNGDHAVSGHNSGNPYPNTDNDGHDSSHASTRAGPSPGPGACPRAILLHG